MSVNILFDSLLEQSEEITGYLLKGYNSAARPLSFSDVVGPINKLGFIIFGTTIALPDISALIYNDVFISHYSTWINSMETDSSVFWSILRILLYLK